jgi:hypothetical protein
VFTVQLFTYFHRCDANPDNLDAGGARLRSQIKTEFLIDNWDPGTLWTDFGVRADIVVSLSAALCIQLPEHVSIAIHMWFPARRHSQPIIT